MLNAVCCLLCDVRCRLPRCIAFVVCCAMRMCLLRVAWSLWFVVFAGRRSMADVCNLFLVAKCLSFVVSCLFVVCCSLCVFCCVSVVGACLLFVAHSLGERCALLWCASLAVCCCVMCCNLFVVCCDLCCAVCCLLVMVVD